MSLFDPDAYLEGEARTVRQRVPRDCCRAWETWERRGRNDAAHPWQPLHRLGHSRVPFTDQWFAQFCDLDMRTAQLMTLAALEAGWLQPAVTELELKPEQGSMWLGALSADRKG